MEKVEQPTIEVQILTKYVSKDIVKEYVNVTLGTRFAVNFVESFTKPGIIYHDGWGKKYHRKHIYVTCTNDSIIPNTREIHLEAKRFTINRIDNTMKLYKDYINRIGNKRKPFEFNLNGDIYSYGVPTKFNADVQELIGIPGLEIFKD